MENKHRSTRREFLKNTGTASAAIAIPYVLTSSALGDDETPPASDRIVMGGIGIGNMGSGDQNAFLGRDDVQYVAVCDVREKWRTDAKGRVDGKYGNSDCDAYVDFRELLARDDIDAVHIATPDHWHAIMVVEACRAGKDVYCQKPECRTLREGPMMVEAARRYARVVSGGSQRVLEDYRGTVDPCWSGEKGTIKSINVSLEQPFSQPCNLPEEEVPTTMEWDLWLGPAPWAAYNGQRCDGNYSTRGGSWRSYQDYSGGAITDWGAHHFGGALFAVDVRELQPSEITFHSGGVSPYISFMFPNGVELTLNKPGAGHFEVVGDTDQPKEAKPVPGYKGTGGIYGDFIECVKTRETPFRDIQLAINTVTVSHLAFTANMLQRSLTWDAAAQEFPGDEEANRFLDRAKREPWQL